MRPFVQALEHAINLPFRLDQEARAGLLPLQGRVMRLSCTKPSQTYDLTFHADHIAVGAPGEHCDVTLTGSVGQFIALMRAKPEQAQQVMAGGLRIEGDIDCAFAIKRLFGRAAIDWEEVLASTVGDIPAHLLSRTFRWARDSARYAATQLATQAVEFAQEEEQILPRPREIDEFLHEVDILRDDVERLSLRVKRLGSR
ncbi:MAG: ubiquinone biosynthesis accessory factor UbiJ [Acidiferrobacter sp.]